MVSMINHSDKTYATNLTFSLKLEIRMNTADTDIIITFKDKAGNLRDITP